MNQVHRDGILIPQRTRSRKGRADPFIRDHFCKREVGVTWALTLMEETPRRISTCSTQQFHSTRKRLADIRPAFTPRANQSHPPLCQKDFKEARGYYCKMWAVARTTLKVGECPQPMFSVIESISNIALNGIDMIWYSDGSNGP